LADDGKTKFLLTGNPGIGKSRFLRELLRRLLLRGRLVVLELRKVGDVFIFVPPRPGQDGGEYRAIRVGYSDWKPANCPALRDKQTYWLIDPAEATEAGIPGGHPADLPARTVLAASPNNAHYKGWHKHELVQTRYMPPWSLDELLAVRPVVREVKELKLPPTARAAVEARDDAVKARGGPAAKRRAAEGNNGTRNRFTAAMEPRVLDIDSLNDDKAVRERYDMYGGVIRIIYGSSKALKEYKKKFDRALARLPDELMLVAFESATEVADLDKRHFEQESKDRVSSALFAYVSAPPFKKKSVVPASPHVMRLVREAYLKRVRRVRDPTTAKYRDAFEHFAGCCAAGAFEAVPLPRKAVDSDVDVATPAHLHQLALPPSSFTAAATVRESEWSKVLGRLVSEYNGASMPAELPEGWSRHSLLLKPDNTNQPVIDFFEVVWLRRGDQVYKVPVAYQATVSTKHPMSPSHLNDLLEALGCTPERPLVLVFVVPDYVFVSRLALFRRQKAVFSEFSAQRCKGMSKKPAADHEALLSRVVQFKCVAAFPNKKG
jgi:hypothetical protein